MNTVLHKPNTSRAAGAIASIAFISVPLAALLVEQRSSELYYLAVQEDEFLEWATTWAFFLAAGLAAIAAKAYAAATDKFPWFLGGLAIFCLVVGMEEISWGQRLFGYRPPDYFLANNFQQELNLHNLLPTDLRKLAVVGVLLGYGVLFPLATLVPRAGTWFGRVGLVCPPLSLVPGFAFASLLYLSYPWSYTGEWVELMMGLGFLYSALTAVTYFRWAAKSQNQPRNRSATKGLNSPQRTSALAVTTVTVMVCTLGIAYSAVTRAQRSSNPALIATAEVELEALQQDLESGRVDLRCSLHKRVYTFVRDYNEPALREGSFAALELQGLPGARAEFFLDPWNTPYWIRDRCSKSQGNRVTFVYSFGPNRRRDSTRYEILGDDIGLWIQRAQ